MFEKITTPETPSQEFNLNEESLDQASRFVEVVGEKNPEMGEQFKESIRKARTDSFVYANDTLDVLLGGKPKPVTDNKSSHDVLSSFKAIGLTLNYFKIPVVWPKESAKLDALIETSALGYVYRVIRDYEKDASGRSLPSGITRDKVEEVAKKFERLDPKIRDNFFKTVKP